MKVKLLCEIEAEIIDKEEIESIENIKNRNGHIKSVEKLWTKVFEEKLEKICPHPVYENRKLKVKAEYFNADEETQIFQLGDTAYMIDEDYRFWESTVKSISLNDGKYYYETSDIDFEFKDIGDWVFESELYRELHLEALVD